MNLHQYLLKIKSDQAINLDHFILLLPVQYNSQWRSIFSSEKVSTKKNSHKLTIKNQQSFNILLENSLPSTSRIEASQRGNSHRQSTSVSFLLLFHQALNIDFHGTENICPDVVLINDNGIQQSFTSKNHLLIIENQENFFRWSAFLNVLTRFCKHDKINESFTLAEFDIAFGSGNNISNAKNIAFFKQYQHITCIFDYDFGGLSIFKSLCTLCAKIEEQQKIRLTFLQPEKAYLSNQYFTNHYFNKTPKNDKHWQQAIVLAAELGFNDLAQAFNKSKNFMEQESYLSAPFTSRAPE